jgi:hypothetical protein
VLFYFRLPARSSWELCSSGLLPIGCPETSVRIYHYLRYKSQQRSSQARISSTAFTSVLLLSLFWLISNQSTFCHPSSCRFNFRLSSHLRLGLPSGLFHSNLSIKTLYEPCSPLYVPYAHQLIIVWFHHTNNILNIIFFSYKCRKKTRYKSESE